MGPTSLSCHVMLAIPHQLSLSHTLFSLLLVFFLSILLISSFFIFFFNTKPPFLHSFFLFFRLQQKKLFKKQTFQFKQYPQTIATNFSIQTIATNNSHKLFNSNNLQLNAMRRASIFTSSILS